METFLFFFIFFTLSYAQPLEILHLPVIDLTSISTVNGHSHHDHDHGAVSTVLDRATEDEIIVSDPTTSRLSHMIDNVKPEVSWFDIYYFGKKQRPVRISNRFPFLPRRCDHNEPDQRFIIPGGEVNQNVVQFMFKKDETINKAIEKGNKEIKEKRKQKKRVMPRGRVVLRHVARRDGAKMNMMRFRRPRLHFRKTIPRPHQRGHAHDDEHDRQGKENIKSDDYKMNEKHDDRDDGFKERGQEVLYKIRKFLNYF